MSLPDGQDVSPAENADTPVTTPTPGVAEASMDSLAESTAEYILGERLSKGGNAELDSQHRVAGLDKARETVADELSRRSLADAESVGPDDAVVGAIETLVRVALELDDPVTGLEEGIESLVEALAARDVAELMRRRAAEERRVDQQAAY